MWAHTIYMIDAATCSYFQKANERWRKRILVSLNLTWFCCCWLHPHDQDRADCRLALRVHYLSAKSTAQLEFALMTCRSRVSFRSSFLVFKRIQHHRHVSTWLDAVCDCCCLLDTSCKTLAAYLHTPRIASTRKHALVSRHLSALLLLDVQYGEDGVERSLIPFIIYILLNALNYALVLLLSARLFSFVLLCCRALGVFVLTFIFHAKHAFL